jgi:Ca2+-binding RTX toxin-like protein
LAGGPGPDTLTSQGHNDWLAGGPGTDVLTLAGSGDTVLGLTADGDQGRNRGADEIVLLYQASPRPIEADLAAGTVRLIGAATGDVITNINRSPMWPYIVMYGTDGNDRMSGQKNGRSQLYGREGNDILAGRSGGDGLANRLDGDILDGGQGDDALTGGDGPDLLDGGAGADVLDGGYGRDQADGGSGSDACTNAGELTRCAP